MRRLARFRALSKRDRSLLLEAAAALATVRLLLAMLPFQMAMRVAGLRSVTEGSAGQDVPRVTSDDVAAASILGRAVVRAARHMPFRAVCLQQAMACAVMLRRRRLPVVVRFGVAKTADGALDAHAWAICGHAILTGAQGRERFIPIATFSP